MDQLIIKKLIEAATEARSRAYVPYSGFSVGAALLGEDGRIFTGCNIENASYGAANCAERTAVFSAVNQGVRTFLAIAVVGGSEGQPIRDECPPCGICRQVLSEFCRTDTPVILVNGSKEMTVYTLGELLPHSFTEEALK